MNAAAVILCAGKGTRMNDDSKNKVCFESAGVPVIRRVVDEMRKGGVSRFVIVVGHHAQSVMDCLFDVPGVAYAYQKEQKGTGHAALCGLNALSAMGHRGSVIVSMGDKIVQNDVIAGLLARSESAKAVWGVQPVLANPHGGRVVTRGETPFGVVELADAALLSLATLPEDEWEAKLLGLGLNEKKCKKVLEKAHEQKPEGEKVLCGERFSAQEILDTRYANAGLYCFDLDAATLAIAGCNASNAQGEIYLTDTLEYFAARGEAALYEIKNSDSMLTYSTKPELRRMSRYFLKHASELIAQIENGERDGLFVSLYGAKAQGEKVRYCTLLRHFIKTYGDRRVILSRAPGRLNLMGRHIDHRGGGINVMTVENDMVLVTGERDDDLVRLTNTDEAYPDRSFSIGECLALSPERDWLSYLASPAVEKALADSRGDWSNYAKSAALRFQLASEMQLCGADIAVSGNIPAAAGLSSSSCIVVASAEALVFLNSMNLSTQEFIDLCGEGEWFVGSRGGAGDHAAMKCCKKGEITHLSFKPFEVGESAPFSEQYAIVVANSMMKARKSEGSKDRFNAKVAAYEFSFMLLKRAYPECEMREFRDLARIQPVQRVYEMILSLPEKMTRAQVLEALPEYERSIRAIFENHADPGEYDLRGVALYGAAECARSEKCIEALQNGDYALLGELMKLSHDGDRIRQSPVDDAELERLIATGEALYLQPGAYGCSTERIDELCDLLNATEGVLGSELVGAGLGGCVIALVESEKAETVINAVNRGYYDRYGYEHSAHAFRPSSGSTVIF